MKPNYLLNQYKKDNKLKISHNYLKEQFFDYSKIFVDIKSEEMVTAEINYTKIKFNKRISNGTIYDSVKVMQMIDRVYKSDTVWRKKFFN